MTDANVGAEVAGLHLLDVLDVEPGEYAALMTGASSVEPLAADREIWVVASDPLDPIVAHHVLGCAHEASLQLGCTMREVSMVDVELLRGRHDRIAAIVLSMRDDERLRQLAANRPVPIINGGSETGYPIEALSDLAVLTDLLGPLAGRHLAVIEQVDASRRSWVEAGALAHMTVRVIGRGEVAPELHHAVAYTALFGGSILQFPTESEVLRDAEVVIGDVAHLACMFGWSSECIVLTPVAHPSESRACCAPHEGPQTLLYHRSRQLAVTLAAVIAHRANR